MLAVRMTSRKKSNGTNFKNDVQKKRQTVESVIDGTKVLSNEKAKLALAGYKINDDCIPFYNSGTKHNVKLQFVGMRMNDGEKKNGLKISFVLGGCQACTLGCWVCCKH